MPEMRRGRSHGLPFSSPKQKGFMNCIVVLCPWLYYFANWGALNNKTEAEISNMPFTFVKIISTPRPSKGRSYFEIQFDKYGN